MIRQADILSYASKHPYFTCRQMVEYFNKLGVKSSLNSVSSRLKRMTESSILTKQDRGVYVNEMLILFWV